jgi:hypothetical protein
MPLFCEAPQPDSAALRARFFGAGRKFTEDLVGVAQTTQLADAGRAVEGGGVTTRWVLMCEFQLPICTGGRPEAAGATSRQLGTRTLLFAPRGAGDCEQESRSDRLEAREASLAKSCTPAPLCAGRNIAALRLSGAPGCCPPAALGSQPPPALPSASANVSPATGEESSARRA